MDRQVFLSRCLALLGAQGPDHEGLDDQGLSLDLSIEQHVQVSLSIGWDEQTGRFLAAVEHLSQDASAPALDGWLLSPTVERASLAARWLQSSASPIAPVIGQSGTLQWQTWLMPDDRGLGGLGDFVAWALAFHRLFSPEPDQPSEALSTFPSHPEDWLELDRLLEVQWTPGVWAQALADRDEAGEWSDAAGLIYSYAWPSGDRPGIATVVLQDLTPHLGLPSSDLGPTLARLNGLLHPQSCCLGIDGRQQLRLMATLASPTAERDLLQLPDLAQAVHGLLRSRIKAGQQMVDQALAAGWTPDTLLLR